METASFDLRHQVAVRARKGPPPMMIAAELQAVRPTRAEVTRLADLLAATPSRDFADLDERVASATAAEAASPEPPALTPAPTPSATPTPPPAPAPRVVPEDHLYQLLVAAFGGEADRAYQIVMCESSGNAATNTGNGYYGMWQFDLPTWQSVGGTGLPSDATVDEQITRARMLYDLRGWAPWSGCVR